MDKTSTNEQLVPLEFHGQRIDIVLAKLLPQYSRSQLTQWLKDGLIKVNQQHLKPKEKVASGDKIVLPLTWPAANNHYEPYQAQAIPLAIIYEDDDLLVINKQAGLVVHPGAGNRELTLVNGLLHHAPQLQQLPRAGIVHRLDKDTTGLLLIGKNLIAHTHLVRQMQAREIERHYLTLVQGHLISGGEIDTAYGRHPLNRLKMAVCAQGRNAITHYFIKKQYDSFTLLEVKLLTGRTHQIRVHMAHINHPVVGDQLYAGRNRLPAKLDLELRTAVQAFKRQALHAASLSFIHPVTEEIMTFTAPLPDDLQQLLTVVDQYLG